MPEGWQVGRQIRSGLGKAAVLGRRVAVRGRCGSVSQMWQWKLLERSPRQAVAFL